MERRRRFLLSFLFTTDFTISDRPSAKGAGSCKPGATPQGKVSPKASAESANQRGVCFKRLRHRGIIAEKDAEVNRTVSAGEDSPRRANINIAPLALNRYAVNDRGYNVASKAGRRFISRPAEQRRSIRAADQLFRAERFSSDRIVTAHLRRRAPISSCARDPSRLRTLRS